MAYVTGNFSDMATLEAGIKTACTDNGWTLTDGILHKNGCYVDIKADSFSNAPTGAHLSILVGNGATSGVLTDAAPKKHFIGPLRSAAGGPWTSWAAAAIYHVHIHENPDEVWAFVNYNGEFWQWLAFGQSPAPGNGGTGNWVDAFYVDTPGNLLGSFVANVRSGAAGVSLRQPTTGLGSICSQPFWFYADYSGGANGKGFMHGAIDDVSGLPRWSSTIPGSEGGSSSNYYANGAVSAWKANAPMYGYTPSVWNSEAVLFPLTILQDRSENKTSIIGILEHARLTRNKFIPPGEILTLGSDRWKIYPTYRRNADVNGDIGSSGRQAGADHSGTFAIAVRYDGP